MIPLLNSSNSCQPQLLSQIPKTQKYWVEPIIFLLFCSIFSSISSKIQLKFKVLERNFKPFFELRNIQFFYLHGNILYTMSNARKYPIFYEKYSMFAQDRRKACAGSDKQVGPFFSWWRLWRRNSYSYMRASPFQTIIQSSSWDAKSQSDKNRDVLSKTFYITTKNEAMKYTFLLVLQKPPLTLFKNDSCKIMIFILKCEH